MHFLQKRNIENQTNRWKQADPCLAEVYVSRDPGEMFITEWEENQNASSIIMSFTVHYYGIHLAYGFNTKGPHKTQVIRAPLGAGPPAQGRGVPRGWRGANLGLAARRIKHPSHLTTLTPANKQRQGALLCWGLGSAGESGRGERQSCSNETINKP